MEMNREIAGMTGEARLHVTRTYLSLALVYCFVGRLEALDDISFRCCRPSELPRDYLPFLLRISCFPGNEAVQRDELIDEVHVSIYRAAKRMPEVTLIPTLKHPSKMNPDQAQHFPSTSPLALSLGFHVSVKSITIRDIIST